tara:strand:- start:2 stop:175 length:174 start_codon:yes stop_codon:yes gene_type:complete
MKANLKKELKEEILKVKNTKGLTPFQREYFLWDLKRDYDTETKKETSKNYRRFNLFN